MVRVLLGVLVAVPVLGGGWLWLRDSPLASVQKVQVSGVHGVYAPEIQAALSSAAGHMTTLDVKLGVLRAAVARFQVVRDVRVTTSFPHGLHIWAVERLPVADLTVGTQRTAVAADGMVLGPSLLSSTLPVIHGTFEPLAGEHVINGELRADLAVLGAAPARLAGFIARVFNGPEGLTVAMRNGLLVYFGNAARPHAKWLSLARVLIDQSSAGAWYVDVRLPDRPAAGTSGASTSTPVQVGASDPTAAALAASLASAVNGGAAASGKGEEASTPASTTPPSSRGEEANTPANPPASSGRGEEANTPAPAPASGG